MTNGEAVNWIINISADIGKVEHKDLWHYEQALSEIRDMLESTQSRKGKWTGVDGLYGCGIYICDQCGKFAMMKSDYCPNCGCRMEEGDSE